MDKLEHIKILGGIGSIVQIIISPIGIILVLIALKMLEDRTKRKNIFSNFLIGVIIGVIVFISFPLIFIPAREGIKGGILFLIIMTIILCILAAVSTIFIFISLSKVAEATKISLFKIVGLLYILSSVAFGLGIQNIIIDSLTDMRIAGDYIGILNYTLGSIIAWILLALAGSILQAIAFFSIKE